MEYKSRTVSNRIQKEILETLKEIKDIIQNPIASNDKVRNKSFNLKCYISNENEINWNIYIKITLKKYIKLLKSLYKKDFSLILLTTHSTIF